MIIQILILFLKSGWGWGNWARSIWLTNWSLDSKGLWQACKYQDSYYVLKLSHIRHTGAMKRKVNCLHTFFQISVLFALICWWKVDLSWFEYGAVLVIPLVGCLPLVFHSPYFSISKIFLPHSPLWVQTPLCLIISVLLH